MKTVLITGCSSGFGLSLAIAFAKKEYHVFATMRHLDKKDALIQAALSHKCLDAITILQLDVLDDATIKQVMTTITKDYQLDLLINNAGFAAAGFIEDVSPDVVEAIIQTNAIGAYRVLHHVVPIMKKQGYGRIINISSVSGLRGLPGLSAYSASKFALEGLSESLYLELLPYHIHVSLVEPAPYATSIWRTDAYLDPTPDNYKQRIYQSLNEAKTTAPDMTPVIKLVVAIAKRKHPKIRYAIGKHHRLFKYFKPLLYSRYFKYIYCKHMK